MLAHKDLRNAENVALLDRIHSQPKGTSHRQLSELLNVPRSRIARLFRQEDERCAKFREGGKGRVCSGQCKWYGRVPKVEEVL